MSVKNVSQIAVFLADSAENSSIYRRFFSHSRIYGSLVTPSK